MWPPQLLPALHPRLHPEEQSQGEGQHRGRLDSGQSHYIYKTLLTRIFLPCQVSDLGASNVAELGEPEKKGGLIDTNSNQMLVQEEEEEGDKLGLAEMKDNEDQDQVEDDAAMQLLDLPVEIHRRISTCLSLSSVTTSGATTIGLTEYVDTEDPNQPSLGSRVVVDLTGKQ